MQNIEISYEKRLSPPEGEPWLETRGGLKYWLVDRQPTIGLQISVLTEDPSISMHRYGGGGREDYGSFLFRYKGFQIGFMHHELGEECWPLPPKSLPEDSEEGRRTGTYIIRITAVGTPVFDPSAFYVRDENRRPIKDGEGHYIRDRAYKRGSEYVTGLSWEDYRAGKRDRFRSRQQQEEMLSIWPDLFTGMWGRLKDLKPGARKTLPSGRKMPIAAMRFSDEVIRQFETGELIDGTCKESAEINFL
ncbi:hypothetical protein JET14_22045 (plasmid) [Martelella lutilitoris]|uniref:Uncharacterized protein n=1 Tax=Martelella lutilitoris TaxID=2583532 RepID=A0A7T7HPS9_9HYPH|nr:hypothetical protein [Martelella lutilitoris]QQM33135.1 hypothetical protein JET14_22045 [Martelella lutilitoris]QRX65286.1 hypothetical protein JS578_13640 [Dysgonomonadaceae bacterium zrk40]